MNNGLGNYSQPNQNPESLTVLQRIAKDDKSAVNDCLDTYGKLVWGLAKKFTKTREDAEDVVQEIFFDIWKNAARFDPIKSPESAFVRLIARRRLVDYLRKSYRRPQTSAFENFLENRANDDHKKLQMYVEMRYAVDALNKLGLHQKQIIEMSVYSGISHSEIAQTIGIPLGTVKTQIRRGLQKIRKSIELPILPQTNFR